MKHTIIIRKVTRKSRNNTKPKVHTNRMTEQTPNIHQTSTKNTNQNDQGGTIIIRKQKITRNLETTPNNNYQEKLPGNLETTPNQKVHANTMTEHTPNIHQTSTKTINQNDQGGQ